MRKTVPSFVFPRFQRLGHQNPVGVLTLVMSPKELASFRDGVVVRATRARSQREVGECPKAASKRAVSVHKFDGFPDMSIEIEISPEGWEIGFLQELVRREVREAVAASRTPDVTWIPPLADAIRLSETKPQKWAHSEADLFRCGEDWLISLMPVLQMTVARALGETKPEPKKQKQAKGRSKAAARA